MLRIELFGRLELVLDGERLDPPTGQARELLAWLALNPGRHPRDILARRFWPGGPRENALHSLRQALYTLRGALGRGSEYLQVEPDEVGLRTEGLWVDALAFEELVQAGHLEEAYELGKEELLAELAGDWVEEVRARHRERMSELLERLAAKAEAEGKLAEAVRWTRERVKWDPDSEQGWVALVRRLAAAGERPAGADTYRRLQEHMRKRRLAVSAETHQLVQGLLEGAPDRTKPGPAHAGPQPGRTPRSTEAPAPPTQAPASQAPASAPPPPRRRRRSLWMLAGIIACLVLVGVVTFVVLRPSSPKRPPAREQHPLRAESSSPVYLYRFRRAGLGCRLNRSPDTPYLAGWEKDGRIARVEDEPVKGSERILSYSRWSRSQGGRSWAYVREGDSRRREKLQSSGWTPPSGRRRPAGYIYAKRRPGTVPLWSGRQGPGHCVSTDTGELRRLGFREGLEILGYVWPRSG